MTSQAEPGGGIFRKPPGRITRWLFRAPLYLYRVGLGRMLGRRTVLLEHTGRKSGLPRETVLEVIRHDDRSFDIAAAYGAKSDWFRNIEADSNVRISIGRIQHAEATAVLADVATAESAFTDYAEAHPAAAKAFGKSLGLRLDDPARMAAVVPVVRITLTGPAAES